MNLKLVKMLDYNQSYAHAPAQVDAVVQTNQIVSVVPTEARGNGPFVRINLKDGTHIVCVGKPIDFVEVEK